MPDVFPWFEEGYAEGQYAAEVNLESEADRNELFWAYQEDRLGEIAGDVRGHQTQMAGDLSYDVDQPGGPTEDEYNTWENGFYQGFHDKVTEMAKLAGIPDPVPYTLPESPRQSALARVKVQPYYYYKGQRFVRAPPR